jgi:hypothetical protein
MSPTPDQEFERVLARDILRSRLMRKFTRVLLCSVFAVGLAGSASALSIQGDLSFFDLATGRAGEVVVLSVATTGVEWKVNFTSDAKDPINGDCANDISCPTASDFSLMVMRDGDNVPFSGQSWTDIPLGGDVTATSCLDHGPDPYVDPTGALGVCDEAIFLVQGAFPNADPKMTDIFNVEYGGQVNLGKGNKVTGPLLEIGDEVWFRIFTGIAKGQTGKGGDTGGTVDISVHGTIVPEVSTSILLGFGLVGLAFVGFRRRA